MDSADHEVRVQLKCDEETKILKLTGNKTPQTISKLLVLTTGGEPEPVLSHPVPS